MITIKLVCVGNLKEKFWQEASAEYEKRLSRFCHLEIVEVPEQNKFEDINRILQEEGKGILSHLNGRSYLLDIQGKEYSSEDFAKELSSSALSFSTLTFVIGGSYGTSPEVKSSIQSKISFGKATYPHNLARVILLEQLYRGFMINSGAKYHK